MKSKTIAAIFAVSLIALSGVAFIYSGIMFLSDFIGSVLLGVVALASSGTTFKTLGNPVNFLDMHFESAHSHLIPVVIGAIMLVGGIVVLLTILKRVRPTVQHLNQAALP